MGLEVRDLTKFYGEHSALEEINISIEGNGIIGLLGPNGAGKSSLMKSIVGALKIEHGSVLLNGIDISKNQIAVKKRTGYLPEDNPLYPDMFVREYLSFVGKLHDISSEIQAEIIDLVGLSPEKNKKISQLSKGYKQRVGIAQAILHSPDYLILDEPTNGLDPNQIVEIRDIIKEIGKTKTVLLSTHLMQEVKALCSRVIVINKGKIINDSPVAEFLGKFETLEQAFQHATKKNNPV